MKEQLLQLLKSNPATAGRPDEFLDSLADDLQAEIIRALSPGTDEEDGLRDAVEHVYQSDFGIRLFNLYSTSDFPGKRPVLFSQRKRIIKALIETLLVEQCIDFECEESELPVVLAAATDGPTLRRRLIELSNPPTKDVN